MTSYQSSEKMSGWKMCSCFCVVDSFPSFFNLWCIVMCCFIFVFMLVLLIRVVLVFSSFLVRFFLIWFIVLLCSFCFLLVCFVRNIFEYTQRSSSWFNYRNRLTPFCKKKNIWLKIITNFLSYKIKEERNYHYFCYKIGY